MTTSTRTLPPGQRARSDFPRFGHPLIVRRVPSQPRPVDIEVTGAVQAPIRLHADDLATLDRREQISDFHCVTTWSATDLRWSGYAFGDVWTSLVVPQARPDARASHVAFTGIDGWRACLPLEDVLAADVLLADRLDDVPLGIDHGAPIRLVAPAHYGFKSVKHLRRIQVLLEPIPDSAARIGHPRGRVALEERGGFLPLPLQRVFGRALIAPLQVLIRLLSR